MRAVPQAPMLSPHRCLKKQNVGKIVDHVDVSGRDLYRSDLMRWTIAEEVGVSP